MEEEVLDWLVHQVEEDEIEEVTDEMLDRLIERTEHLAVLFCEYFTLLHPAQHDMLFICGNILGLALKYIIIV